MANPEQVALRHALQQGWISTDDLQRVHVEAAERTRRGQPTTALSLIGARLAPPALAALQAVYRQAEAEASDAQTVLRSSGSGVAPSWVGSGSGIVAGPDEVTVAPLGGSARLAASAADPDRAAAEAAYRRAVAADASFAPHAALAFEELETLGQGGMGVVLRVHDRRLGRPAALKRIRGEAAPELVARFQREAEITARLDHPSIPPVYEAGTDPAGHHYMLMKVIEGEPLSERIQAAFAGGPPPVGRVGPVGELLEALVKVGEAVAYAHSKGVIHRDLKPANVMVGRFGEVLVLDWGLARRAGGGTEDDRLLLSQLPAEEQEASGPELTQAGSVLGTPGYMPPEQVEGEADERADVFGLGAILTAILTNAPPVEGASAINRLNKTLQGKIERPRDRRRDVPRELDAIAAAALEADPAQRTPTAAAFVRDLRAYLASEQVACHRYSLGERVGRWARRHPALVAAGAVAGVLALVGVAVVTRAQQTTAVETRQAVAQEGLAAAREAAEKAWGKVGEGAGTGLALRALTAAQRWRNLAPGDAAAEAALNRAASRLGELAISKREWDLARAALAQVGAEERVDAAQRADDARRTREVRELIASAESGALAKRRNGIADAVYAITRYAEPATTRLLAEVVTGVARELLAAEAAVLRAAGRRPGLEEAIAIRAKTPIDARLPQSALGPLIAAERAVAAAAKVRDTGRDATRGAFLRAVAERQAASVSLGRLQAARLALEALGRIGIEEGAVEAIAEYVKAEADDARARVAVEALMRFPGERAARVILAAGERRPNSSYFRIFVRDLLQARGGRERAPLPEGVSAKRLLEIGNTRETGGDLPGALQAYLKATVVEPTWGEAWVCVALARYRLGDPRRALRILDKAQQVAPRLAGVYAARGLICEQTGLNRAGITAYGRALELDPEMVHIWINRGKLHLRLNDRAAARKDLDTALRKAPEDADAWAARGGIRREQGEREGAIADCTRALELDPNHAYAYFNRGTVHLDRKAWREATRDLRRALELDPTLVVASNALGRVFLHQGLPLKAVQQATASLRRDPTNLAALWLRGTAYEQAGARKEAIRDYERLLQLAPNHAVSDRVRARIDALLKP